MWELRRDEITGWWSATVVDREFDSERFHEARLSGARAPSCANSSEAPTYWPPAAHSVSPPEPWAGMSFQKAPGVTSTAFSIDGAMEGLGAVAACLFLANAAARHASAGGTESQGISRWRFSSACPNQASSQMEFRPWPNTATTPTT